MSNYSTKLPMILWLIFWSWTSACSHPIQVVRAEKNYPPLPQNCSLRFEIIDPENAMQEYEPLGTISLESDLIGDFNEEIKKLVRPYACQMGGELVIPFMGDENWVDPKATFMVLRAKPKPETPKEKPQPQPSP